jgi:hypothetical protein
MTWGETIAHVSHYINLVVLSIEKLHFIDSKLSLKTPGYIPLWNLNEESEEWKLFQILIQTSATSNT